MIINYGLRKDGTFDFWQVYPIVDDLPKLEIDDPRIIVVGKTKLINGKIVQPQSMDEELKENALNQFRAYRKETLKLFDIWEKNVLRGREVESEEVMLWYQEMLNFTNLITKDTTPQDYPQTPEAILKYSKY
jgi:hypothetical protein